MQSTTSDSAITKRRLDEARILAARAFKHFHNKTTDQADAPMRLPVENYYDADQYDREIDKIFRKRPIASALSLELPSANTYAAKSIAGIPLLITRDKNGDVRAFLNVCRHRGAVLCEPSSGRKTRFSCPYHSWTFDNTGALIGIYGEASFGEIDRDSFRLTELYCVERCGLIWVCLTPDLTFEIDDWLDGIADQLETLGLSNWHLFEQRDIDGPGWKVTLDGYLEVYHHDTVHRATVGDYTIGNLLVHDTFGPHQRLTFGRKTLADIDAPPDDPNEAERHIRIIHSVFPNLSISGIVGGFCLVSQVFPGKTPETTVTRQSILCSEAPDTEEKLNAVKEFSAMTLQAVQEEDYKIGFSIQSAIKSGANKEFVFGRNEPGLQHYHRTVAKIMGNERGCS